MKPTEWREHNPTRYWAWRLARAIGRLPGYRARTERSPASNTCYVHAMRPGLLMGTWYDDQAFRVSDHYHPGRCSIDVDTSGTGTPEQDIAEIIADLEGEPA